uniref:Molybdenum cofactor biosynthesis protein A-like twitch domain-containing protein n=2 Tax=Octactis speculum TaxID=3111310 RepID=A0A7S2MHL8_9STRA|mmetsp:Transcript_62561/g.85987  ORF Transcript_62561/g.85987 Transcript_62561/m.85987 type:complete len:169 (+) Transcript_62561:346-852(+)
MKGTNDEELSDFVAMTKNVPLDVRFIEWMPFDKNAWNDTQFMSRGEMLEVLRADGVELQRVSDAPNDTTKWYRPEGGSVGRVGFITSMSDHFCGSCNRVRLTADGKLKACLFGNGEFDLRGPLRSGDESMLSRAIGSAVQGKHFKLGGHEDMYAISVSENRPMILIGG